MRVLIVAEGVHEREGALPTLVKRINAKLVCECDNANTSRLRSLHRKGGGFEKRALRWLIRAEKKGYDAVVFLIDRDRNPDRVKQIDKAQEDKSQSELPRALGVAIESFDAWMLADETALSQALRMTVSKQKDPETLRNPKAICENLRDEADTQQALRAMYDAVAAYVNLEVLKKRCPRGFEPFAKRVEAL